MYISIYKSDKPEVWDSLVKFATKELSIYRTEQGTFKQNATGKIYPDPKWESSIWGGFLAQDNEEALKGFVKSQEFFNFCRQLGYTIYSTQKLNNAN